MLELCDSKSIIDLFHTEFQVKFLFDFIAPKYCGQRGGDFFDSPPCPHGAVMLEVEEEFTKVGTERNDTLYLS